jgi:hypothetical protein
MKKCFNNLFTQKNVNLSLSGQAEAGNGGDQPARNNPSDRNDGGPSSAPCFTNHFGSECLGKRKLGFSSTVRSNTWHWIEKIIWQKFLPKHI